MNSDCRYIFSNQSDNKAIDGGNFAPGAAHDVGSL